MRFTLAFLLASNLLVASLTWFVTSERAVAEPIVVDEAKVEPEPVKNGIIEYFTMPNCAPCIKFKNSGAIRELESKGWKVVKVESGSLAPTFTVWIDGKPASWTGFSSKSSFFRILKLKMKDLRDANRR